MNRVALALAAAVALPIAVLAQTTGTSPPPDTANATDPASNMTDAANNTTDAMSNTTAPDNATTDKPTRKEKKKPMDATE